jgi:hypothetical protein
MAFEENENSQDELRSKFHRHHLQRHADDEKGRFFLFRQWLNGCFLVLSIIGMIVWYTYSPEIGGITLIAAVACKFTELSLRIMKI